MLNNASGFRKVYVAAGYTDLRRGIDGLASIVKFNFQLDPYEKDILFLFCGRLPTPLAFWLRAWRKIERYLFHSRKRRWHPNTIKPLPAAVSC